MSIRPRRATCKVALLRPSSADVAQLCKLCLGAADLTPKLRGNPGVADPRGVPDLSGVATRPPRATSKVALLRPSPADVAQLCKLCLGAADQTPRLRSHPRVADPAEFRTSPAWRPAPARNLQSRATSPAAGGRSTILQVVSGCGGSHPETPQSPRRGGSPRSSGPPRRGDASPRATCKVALLRPSADVAQLCKLCLGAADLTPKLRSNPGVADPRGVPDRPGVATRPRAQLAKSRYFAADVAQLCKLCLGAAERTPRLRSHPGAADHPREVPELPGAATRPPRATCKVALLRGRRPT